MSKFAGKDMLIYISDEASPETFNLIAGLRSKSFSINNEQIDVTDSDGSRWRKLLEGGVKSCSLSGAGILQDNAVHQELLNRITGSNGLSTIANFRIVFAKAGTSLTGPFQLTSFEGSGEYTDSQQYTVSMESADDVTLAFVL